MDNLPDIPDEPLEYEWRPRAGLQIPAELVNAVAQGLEDPAEVAERFGFTGSDWENLKVYKPFELAVAARKAELEKNGDVFRLKAALGAEMLLEKTIVAAMGVDVSLGQRIEALKTLSKLGALEPKEDKTIAAGAGFQIQINLGGQSLQLGGSPTMDLPVITAAQRSKPIDILEIPLEDSE